MDITITGIVNISSNYLAYSREITVLQLKVRRKEERRTKTTGSSTWLPVVVTANIIPTYGRGWVAIMSANYDHASDGCNSITHRSSSLRQPHSP